MPGRWFEMWRGSRGDDEERLARRLLQSAAMQGDQPTPSPFFLARLKARIATSEPSSVSPSIGAAAWQMLPAFAIVVAIVTGWMGYEAHCVEEARQRALARLTQSESGVGDALVAATLLGYGVSTERPKEAP